MSRGGLRDVARQALELHNAGENAEALACAMLLSGANPTSALALNLLGNLHVHAGGATRDERAPGADDDEAAVSALESFHFDAALDAFSAAAHLAPNCVLTAIAHAEALSAHERYADAQRELLRAMHTPARTQDDPALHHVGYDVLDPVLDTSANERRKAAVRKAGELLAEVTAIISQEIVPREAAELLAVALDADIYQLRDRAKLFSEAYRYSAGARLLPVLIELERARALDVPIDRRRHLLRGLDLISDAAGTFADSHLIALFHAKILFALGELDDSETECRRALRIEVPSEPAFDHIPPAVSVPGADYGSRVASVKRQLRILLKRIVVVAGVCWSSIQTMPQHRESADRVISVKVDRLEGHCAGIDKSAEKTVSDALRFLKNQSSWSFLLCPYPGCHGKKFVDTEPLWEHMRKKHRDVLWDKLQSVLGPYLNEKPSNDHHSLDGITLRQDSELHDIFHLPRLQPMFESLLLSPSIGIQAEPLAELRGRKCSQGAEIFESIKKKLRMLPKDTHTEFQELCIPIQDLWLKFLETSALDHREVILPLARSCQWVELKKLIAHCRKDLLGYIGCANIDIIFGKVPAVSDRNVSVVHGSKPSHASSIDHQSGDNLQTENLQPSCSDETLKDGEKREESEARVVDNNSETMLDQRSSDPPIDIQESGLECLARIAGLELEKKGTFGQSAKEMARTSNKNNADKDLSILSLVIQSLCNLRHFRDKFLTEPLVWIPSADNICIAQQFYEIFTSWEKNDHHLTDVVLTYMKSLLRGVDCAIFSEKVGTNFASEIVATILIGLHMSETCSRFSFNKETEKHVVNPITCGDCICPTHNLFGIKFKAQMSCDCGEYSGEYMYIVLFHKLDAGSPQTTKIKSFAELPVLSDEQFCKDNNCGDCGSQMNIDLFLSNTPHFFTIVLNWLGGSESQDTLSEVLAGITSPLDTGFFCKSANSSAMYAVTSMICYADEHYVCFARDDEDKWLIYDFETVEKEDTWEHVLERFKDCKLKPEVLIFEVIK